MKRVYLVNSDSTFSNKTISFLKENSLHYVICHSQSHMLPMLHKKVKEGYDSFIVSGGDGTVNNFINSYMKLAKNQRAKINFGVLPSGKANDLASELGFPRDISSSNKILNRMRTKKIDIIQINEKYFITGGGFGLPVDVVLSVNNFSRRYYYINRVIKDLVYYFFVLKNIFIGYGGIGNFKLDKVNYNSNYMLLSILNQQFIGKRFNLSPNAKNSDGLMDICIVPKKKSFQDLIMVNKIVKGKHITEDRVSLIRKKEFIIKTKNKRYFMGDGELLVFSNTFKFKVIPKAIRVFY